MSFNPNSNGKEFDLKHELFKYLIHWRWFVFSVSCFVTITLVFLRYAEVQYISNVSIIFKENEKSNLGELMPFSDLGIGSNSNLKDNQILILKSRSLIEKTLKQLELNKVFIKQGIVKQSEVYKDDCPIVLKYIKEDKAYFKLDTVYAVSGLSKTKYMLRDNMNNKVGEFTYGEVVATKRGDIVVNLNPIYFENNPEDYVFDISVQIQNLESLLALYMMKLNVVAVSKTTDVVNLSIIGPIKTKSEDFLEYLIEIYNQEAINDERLISKKTVDFVDDRLELITSELKSLEVGTEEFKKENKVTDIVSQAGIYLESADAYESTLLKAHTDKSIIEAMIKMMDENGNDELIPTGMVPENANAESMISDYNKLVLDRNRIASNSSPNNPTVLILNKKIEALRKSVKSSLNSVNRTIDITINKLSKQEQLIDNRISRIPKQERLYREITRKQEIKEALFLFLIEKREDAAIMMEIAAPISKVVDEPYTKGVPVFPKKGVTLFGAILLGISLPGFIIYLLNLFDTKVKHRKDVENVIEGIPYLGDIPSLEKGEENITQESRSSTAEALRMLRTNIEFMLTNVDKSKARVIFVTSTIPGEGKTFMSVNLAKTIAFTSKKVLLLGFDIRKPKLDDYLQLPSKGITNYLLNEKINLNELIVPFPGLNNLHVLSAGTVPPNPSELLLSDRVDDMFEILKAQYDYIVVDTAPIALVTDTVLLSKHSDLFVYVVRSNYLENKMLEVSNKLYKDEKITNMAFVLNDTSKKMNGYGYGYGANGGYYQSEEPKKSIVKRLFG